MYSYIKGKVADINKDNVILENQDIGYIIYTTHPYDYKIGQVITFYTFYHVREEGPMIYGFNTKDERNVFYKLIDVKGIGPKMAINILSGTDVASFIDAIDHGNISFLRKLPSVGPKSAQQLIVELRGRFDLMEKGIKEENSLALADARAGLLALGFKSAAIDDALSQLRGKTLTTQEYIKKALALLKTN